MLRPQFLALVATILSISLAAFSPNLAFAEFVVYSNDFDGNTQMHSGVSASIVGGTNNGGGITSSQGYNSFAEFGGDFWRVTAPNDVLEIKVQNVPGDQEIAVEFSLAIIDSWDATSPTWGPDFLNIAILDGATQVALISEPVAGGTPLSSNVESVVVLRQQLGFRGGSQVWWRDDGYRMRFDNLSLATNQLTFQIWGSGSGFQGGNDESFAVDNFRVLANPEPSAGITFASLLAILLRRKKTR